MPEVRILPTLKEVGSFVVRALSFLPDKPLARGDHVGNTGAAPMLDAQLVEADDIRAQANTVIN